MAKKSSRKTSRRKGSRRGSKRRKSDAAIVRRLYGFILSGAERNVEDGRRKAAWRSLKSLGSSRSFMTAAQRRKYDRLRRRASKR